MAKTKTKNPTKVILDNAKLLVIYSGLYENGDPKVKDSYSSSVVGFLFYHNEKIYLLNWNYADGYQEHGIHPEDITKYICKKYNEKDSLKAYNAIKNFDEIFIDEGLMIHGGYWNRRDNLPEFDISVEIKFSDSSFKKFFDDLEAFTLLYNAHDSSLRRVCTSNQVLGNIKYFEDDGIHKFFFSTSYRKTVKEENKKQMYIDVSSDVQREILLNFFTNVNEFPLTAISELDLWDDIRVKKYMLKNVEKVYEIPGQIRRLTVKQQEIINNVYKDDALMREALAILKNVGIPSKEDGVLFTLYSRMTSKGADELKTLFKTYPSLFKDEVVESINNMLDKKKDISVRTFKYDEKTTTISFYINGKEIIKLDLRKKKVLSSTIPTELAETIFYEFLSYEGLSYFKDKNKKYDLTELLLESKYPFLEKLRKCNLNNIMKSYVLYLKTTTSIPGYCGYWNGNVWIEEGEKTLERYVNNNSPLTKLFGLNMNELTYINSTVDKVRSPGNLAVDFKFDNDDQLTIDFPEHFENIFTRLREYEEVQNVKLNTLSNEKFKNILKLIIHIVWHRHTHIEFTDSDIIKILDIYDNKCKDRPKLREKDRQTTISDIISMVKKLKDADKFVVSKQMLDKLEKYKDFEHLHDDLVRIQNLRSVQKRIAQESNNQRILDANKELLESRRKLKYKDDLYTIFSPEKLEDIIWEGNMLGHCVGSYTQRHASGVCTILFLRKNDDLDRSFFTIEIRDNQIVQIHGKSNCWLGSCPDAIPTVIAWCKKNKITYKNDDILSTDYYGGNLAKIPDRVSVEVVEEETTETVKQ